MEIYQGTEGDDEYQPIMGFSGGEDAIWIPTPDEMVMAMLTAAGVTANDIVCDLGAGDGRIAIAAAQQFGAQAIGIECNPDMAALAQRNVQRAGVADKVQIIQGNIFEEDFSNATVVTMYLMPEANLRLRPILEKMSPGTRIVSHCFDMPTWKHDQFINSIPDFVWNEVDQIDQGLGYMWVIPVKTSV
jgi:cyclopropane fatty-acyl-phospholipid synthase-like methyltransferase